LEKSSTLFPFSSFADKKEETKSWTVGQTVGTLVQQVSKYSLKTM
jgi:hypothetical protein